MCQTNEEYILYSETIVALPTAARPVYYHFRVYLFAQVYTAIFSSG